MAFRAPRKRVSNRGAVLRRLHRISFDLLEDRLMLDSGLPSALVVGRTLAVPQPTSSATPALPSYFVGEVQNNQVAITYTVYNEQADPETGVLLTTTLAPGVTIASDSQSPVQSGQKLAWNLGTIDGFERSSVTLTVNIPTPSTTQLDVGASSRHARWGHRLEFNSRGRVEPRNR